MGGGGGGGEEDETKLFTNSILISMIKSAQI